MEQKISVVVVCKNEADVIEQLVKTVQPVSDDIVIYDNGSTDGTIGILEKCNVRLYQGEWLGYGKTKSMAISLARHDWILSLDADESLDSRLQEELKHLSLADAQTAFDIPFKNFLGSRHLRWGEWGGDHHVRLFNRELVNWNDVRVHEELLIPRSVRIQKLKGHILHHTMKDVPDYSSKMMRYAMLNAEKYFEQGRRSSWMKRWLSPSATFLFYYFLRLGFLDGWEGYVAARMTSFYTFVKYSRLHELWRQSKQARRGGDGLSSP